MYPKFYFSESLFNIIFILPKEYKIWVIFMLPNFSFPILGQVKRKNKLLYIIWFKKVLGYLKCSEPKQ